MQAHFQAFNIHSALRKAKSYKYHYNHFVKLLHKRLGCMWVVGKGGIFLGSMYKRNAPRGSFGKETSLLYMNNRTLGYVGRTFSSNQLSENGALSI